MFINTIIIIVALCFSVYGFKKCAGTLNPGKLNIISATFYLFLVQIFIGAALIQLGMDKHYTLDNLVYRQESINITFYVVMATAVIWPLCIYLFQRLFRLHPGRDYDLYLDKRVSCKNENQIFWYVLMAGLFCSGLLVVYIGKIGYIPLVKLFEQPEGFDFALERIRIGQIVLINQQIRNVLILLAIPLMAYVSFAYALARKTLRWIVLAFAFFILSVITKTYNFEKSPLVFHLAIYVIICIYQFGGIRRRWMVLFSGAGLGILVFAYSAVGTNTISLYNGIIGRTILTPVGALAYNFDMFPKIFPYLMGRSATPTLLKLFGINPALYLRSAKLTMEFYGSERVYEGTAGVMNSLYLGEAYANFGWAGLAFSLLWTGLIIACLYKLFFKVRKSPVTIALNAYIVISVATTTLGGFFDFIYNALWIVAIAALLTCEYLPDWIQCIKKFLHKKERNLC